MGSRPCLARAAHASGRACQRTRAGIPCHRTQGAPRRARMKWASAVSERADLEEAMEEAAAEIRTELGGSQPDLAAVFVSPHHAQGYERVSSLVAKALGPRVLLGCSGGGVIGGGQEVEYRPGPLSDSGPHCPEWSSSPSTWRREHFRTRTLLPKPGRGWWARRPRVSLTSSSWGTPSPFPLNAWCRGSTTPSRPASRSGGWRVGPNGREATPCSSATNSTARGP